MENTQKVDIKELTRWFKTDLLPQMAKMIGKSCDDVTVEITVPKDCFFASFVYFANIKFQNDESISVVIKKPVFAEKESADLHTRELFQNEVIFYKEVAPSSDKFPRCFYAHDDTVDGKMSAIVMENVETMGFKMCPQVSDIPLKYIIAGVREMARFHGMGYLMKTNQSEKFFKIVDKIQETRYFFGEWCETMTNLVSPRPVNYLRKQNYDSIFCDKMEKYLKKAFQTVSLDTVKPCEPLDVLCHGDFIRNNIFYRETDSGLETILIDFALLRYSSPAIDLSTFLYMSCSAKNICEDFDEIFSAYHNELIDYLEKGGIKEIDCYSYDKMLADYKRRAMYGYITALFWTPILRGLVIADPTTIGTDEFTKYCQRIMDAGGDELSKQSADLLINLRTTGCLTHVLSST